MTRIRGVVVLVIGVLILVQAIPLSVGRLAAPGPGFFPAVIAGALIVLSLVLMFKKDEAPEGNPFSARPLGRILVVFSILLGYCLLIDRLGFVLVSFLLMAFFFLWVARLRWYVALLAASLSTGIAYIVFDLLLKSNLPRGLLGG